MTERVDFYVLKSSTTQQRCLVACRLTEKAYLRALQVVIVSDSQAQAQALDDLLWTFNERAFIPHAIYCDAGAADPEVGVHLTWNEATAPPADLLVNLAPRLPQQLSRYARIAEIIDADEDCRRLGRERFKAYRDLKLTLDTHQLEVAADA